MLNLRNVYIIDELKQKLIEQGTHPNRIKIVIGSIVKLFNDSDVLIENATKDQLIKVLVSAASIKYQEHYTLDTGSIGNYLGMLRELKFVIRNEETLAALTTLSSRDVVRQLKNVKVTNASRDTRVRNAKRKRVSRKTEAIETVKQTPMKESSSDHSIDLIELVKATVAAGMEATIDLKSGKVKVVLA